MDEAERIPCPHCAEMILPNAKVCRFCRSTLTTDGSPTPSHPVNQDVANKKLAAGLCGIFFGQLGIHKFLLGYTSEAVTMLVVSLVGGIATCGLSSMVMAVIGIVEGITYLTRSDAAFEETYIHSHKGWF